MEGANRLERRFTEIRANGRTLTGTVMAYGDVADRGAFQESFHPGAFGDVADLELSLNVMHAEHRILTRTGSGLVFHDSPTALLMSAQLPATRESDDTLTLVNDGTLTGLSIEFESLSENWKGELRSIARAYLGGLGVVDSPSYKGSQGLSVRRILTPQQIFERRTTKRRKLWQLL